MVSQSFACLDGDVGLVGQSTQLINGSLLIPLARTIPLAAIVTPGSLSVRPRLLSNTTSLYVPEPLYTRYHSYYYYAVDGYGERASHNGDGYVSPDGVDSDPVFITSSNLIHKLAFGAAASSQPVSLPSANQNQTYHLDFDGPAVKCSPANESIMYNVTVDQGLNYGSTRRNTFLSWVGSGLNSTLATQPSPQTLDYYSLDAARIWVMTNIDYWNESVHTPFPDSPPPMYQNDTYWRDYYTFMKVNVTECQLYNASYSVDFQFQYPNQTRQVSISKWLHPITAINFWDPVSEVVDVLPHLALMNAFGKVLLVGSYTESEYAFKLSYSSWNIINIDWTRAKAIPSGLEQLFQNITLSALSDASLMYVLKAPLLHTYITDNISYFSKNSTTGAQPVPVTAVTYPISYHYDPFDLPLPYGLSLLFTLICAGIGLRAFFLNDHASFQNLFSTYLRATSGLDIKGLVPVGDTGADPLSKSIAKARIVVGEERGS